MAMEDKFPLPETYSSVLSESSFADAISGSNSIFPHLEYLLTSISGQFFQRISVKDIGPSNIFRVHSLRSHHHCSRT